MYSQSEGMVIIYGDTSSRTSADVKMIRNLVAIEGKSLLELGCGEGRITQSIAEEVRELVAIDIDSLAIKHAQQRSTYANVTFLVENIEDFNLGREFDVVLSIGVGYMYLKDAHRAIENIANHLREDGIALLICSSPEDEYQQIVDLLVDASVRTISFYNKFEGYLASHFMFEKQLLQQQIRFSNLQEIWQCFQRELKEEYDTEMNEQHTQLLAAFFQDKEPLTVGVGFQAYICRNK